MIPFNFLDVAVDGCDCCCANVGDFVLTGLHHFIRVEVYFVLIIVLGFAKSIVVVDVFYVRKWGVLHCKFCAFLSRGVAFAAVVSLITFQDASFFCFVITFISEVKIVVG